MKDFDSEIEWQALREELFKTLPKTAPYSAEIVKARENLLKAQVLLSAYENEISVSRREMFAKRYLQIMQNYFESLPIF